MVKTPDPTKKYPGFGSAPLIFSQGCAPGSMEPARLSQKKIYCRLIENRPVADSDPFEFFLQFVAIFILLKFRMLYAVPTKRTKPCNFMPVYKITYNLALDITQISNNVVVLNLSGLFCNCIRSCICYFKELSKRNKNHFLTD